MKKALEIIFTSDIHGHVFPVDYPSGEAENSGILNMAHQIKKEKNMLVLDGGDSLQGTPLLQYYIAHRKEYPHHPVAEALRAAGCDYFTLGNHDFNFGYETLRDYVQAMQREDAACAHPARCLCANVEDLRGELGIEKTAVHVLENGLRVGITGIVTDYVNVWEQPQNLSDLRITDAFEAAQKACAELRAQCDFCICIYHGGYEEDLETGRLLTAGGENIACRIARELDFDLLLTGHQHMKTDGRWLYGTYTLQPPANAGCYARVRVELSADRVFPGGGDRNAQLDARKPGTWTGDTDGEIFSDEEKMEAGPGRQDIADFPEGGASHWHISSFWEQVAAEHDAQPYQRLLPLERETQKWLDEPVGFLGREIPAENKLEAALYGSELADLFNQVQLAETGADFSCTSLGNTPVGLEREVTMRAICGAYLFANTLVVLEVDEKVLRAALERCASYFTLKDGRIQISEEFIKPKIEHYNYDFYAGLQYRFDLEKPVGQRVVTLKKADGTELGDKKYRLVTSNYRATGTGGYEALAECPVLWRGDKEMPELIADYIRKNSPVLLRQSNPVT
ncbi:5'-nucleotidase, C-terminal domain protein [Marvinbryantia formatexigens DSM 14469]|uniref:5'-nucleotidase, C-terminal domain protein n=1 Tax=Marvinbryantia formatexigens DSM 14469 TaxID=478749 RepID=C6LI73_9FIRM|nr:bifunctional UDP-sugar hydrolase/5'-nucleotidase [Marvinbryantia formatexigens]EET59728.1 5'-nucleotidase, C-terminal domain protein [Marvinbryantia formatexigens DSM 14469]UWO26624.1 bifunctional metallophosphatase/5'-nucleotidase [Marvinbryantia formatexigens DSM 14469]SDG46742.1 2',3'-cyclic-nucleotide 2'-phosphodiesterase/5'-or 3'-nucleotidase, 5'-nucleotidase family [Marvinbryantia formatexigens]